MAIYSGLSHEKWWLSILMLSYKRAYVNKKNCNIHQYHGKIMINHFWWYNHGNNRYFPIISCNWPPDLHRISHGDFLSSSQVFLRETISGNLRAYHWEGCSVDFSWLFLKRVKQSRGKFGKKSENSAWLSSEADLLISALHGIQSMSHPDHWHGQLEKALPHR